MFFFKPETLGEMLPIALILAGVMAGGISVLSYLKESYASFATPIAITLITGFLTMGQQTATVMGYMLIIYTAACLYFSRSFNKVLTETLRLEHRNDALMAELRKEKEMAEQANRAKSRFLAAASHDLRQPLHALSLLFEAIKEADSIELRRSLYPKIEMSIEALSGLFNALLDISKLDAGVVEANLEDFYIQDVIKATMHEYETQAENKNLSMRVHCSDSIVYSDRVFLERIIRNLLSNAVRYTEAGGVLVSCRKRGDRVMFQVWDTGIGIPEAEISTVFSEFYQLHNIHRDRSQGLGLGLSIVRRLCELLDHPVELSSRPGTGSVVTILIPAGNPQHVRKESHPAAASPWDLTGLCVLVIDDDIEVLAATSVLLKKWGCQVITALSSSDALDKITAAAAKPDFALSDLRLPGNENGIQALDAIRSRLGTDIPAILITGDTRPERINLARQSGYKVLHKPLKPAQLRTAIHQLLTSRAVITG
jgi:signal transduction histidine kinase